MPTTVRLGNTQPVAVYRVEHADDARRLGASDAEVKALREQLSEPGNNAADFRRKLKGQTTTTIGVIHDEPMRALAEADALWRLHESDGPPAWVEASGDLAQVLEQHFVNAYSDDKHTVKSGQPKGWKVTVEL